MNIDIDITTECEKWAESGLDISKIIETAVHCSIKHSAFKNILADKSAEISIVLADDAFIQALNQEYRDKDKPTNVLSFPQTDFTQPETMEHHILFGDIIFSFQKVRDEATKQRKSFRDHFTHLAVHGTLHLMGYDHEIPHEAEKMEKLEIDILKQLAIENPYSDTNFMA